MNDLIAWITENWVALVAILYAVLNVANGITKLTKTEKDDKIVEKIIDFLSILPKSNAKGSLKLPGTTSKPQE